MKKFLVVMVVLALVGLSSIALAADVSVGGSVQIRSRDFNDLSFDKNAANTSTKNQVDTQERIILNVNAKAGDDVKGKISLWNDFTDWGSNGLDKNFGGPFGSSTSGLIANSGSNGAFGFREAWVSFNMPGIPVNVTSGHQLLQLGDGWFLRSMHFGSEAWVVANVTGNNTFAVADIKVSEGANVAITSDDVDAYAILDVLKLNDAATVGVSLGNAHLGSGNDLYDLGLNFAGKLGPVNLKAQADVQTGKNKASGSAVQPKYSGNEIAIKGNVPMDAVTINFLVGMGSGKKATDTDNKQFVTFLDVDPHYTFLYEYKLATAGGPAHTGLSNTTVASVGASFAASKSLTVGADVYYLQATQKITNGVGTQSSDVGTELDANVKWKLYDNLSWNWDLGYFKPGAAFKTAAGKTDAATGIMGVLGFNF